MFKRVQMHFEHFKHFVDSGPWRCEIAYVLPDAGNPDVRNPATILSRGRTSPPDEPFHISESNMAHLSERPPNLRERNSNGRLPPQPSSS
jgi:hypothetical protein